MTAVTVEIAGLIANILSNVAFVPQIIKSYRRKKVDDVSIGMFLVLFTTQICWILYAVPLGAENLWISSLIEIALLTPIFIMWFKYRTKSPRFNFLKKWAIFSNNWAQTKPIK